MLQIGLPTACLFLFTAVSYLVIVYITYVYFRYMYWTDWGHFPRIERAYMNGEERMDLVNHTIGWPNGLTIDHVYNKLYWADAREDNIEVMDLATLERKVVLNQKFFFCK